jgi:hypothetical protein
MPVKYILQWRHSRRPGTAAPRDYTVSPGGAASAYPGGYNQGTAVRLSQHVSRSARTEPGRRVSR